MEINPRQRRVLAGCACAVLAMLLYPPLQFRGIGQGYGWIFATESGQTINASQLLVQWLAVGIVGAIAFVLASGVQPPPSGAPWPGLRHVLGIAYRNSRTWRWILLSAIIVSVVSVIAGAARPASVVGKILAALLLYTCIFIWHCWIARRGEEHVQAERAVSWRRVSMAVLALIVVVGAVIGWEFITQRPSEERWWERDPLADSRPAAPQEPTSSREAGSAPAERGSRSGYFDDLIPSSAQSEPLPAGRFVPDSTPKK